MTVKELKEELVIVMTSDKTTAEFYRDMLSAYDWSECKEPLQIGW